MSTKYLLKEEFRLVIFYNMWRIRKIKDIPELIQHQTIKIYWGVEVQILTLTAVLR
jgi:hypothetical protein